MVIGVEIHLKKKMKLFKLLIIKQTAELVLYLTLNHQATIIINLSILIKIKQRTRISVYHTIVNVLREFRLLF